MRERQIVIIGATNYAQLVRFYLEHDAHWTVCAFSVEAPYITRDSYAGLPLVPFETLSESYPPDEYEVVLGIGYSKMNDVRKKLYHTCKRQGYELPNYTHSSAIISPDVDIQGDGNIIMEATLVQPFVSIGSANCIWCNASIAHNVKIGSFNTISVNASLAGFAIINDNCFLGTSSTIRDGITIKDYTFVGGATYVAKSTHSYAVVVPARSVALENKKSTDML